MSGRDRWLYAWGLGYAAVGMASLLVPLYALTLGGGALAVGGLASTAAFAGVPGALLWGWLAARTGRRRVFVLVSLGAITVVLLTIPFVRSLALLVAANALFWFVVSAAAPVLTLLVVEGFEEDEWERRIGRLNAFQGYGWVAGLLLGSFWLPAVTRAVDGGFAQRSLFAVGAAIAAVALPAAWRWLPRDTSSTPERIARSPNALERLASGSGRVRTVPFVPSRLPWRLSRFRPARLRTRFSRSLRAYLLVVTVFSAAFAAFWGPLPAYLADVYADEVIFWLFLAANLASAICYGPVGRLASERAPDRLQHGALSIRIVLFPLVGGIVLALAPPVELPALLATFALIGASWAVIAVTAAGIVTRLAGPARAEALGLYTALAGLGGGLGSLAGGWLASRTSYPVVFAVAGAGVLLSVVLAVATTRDRS